jgi:hypothetical protein
MMRRLMVMFAVVCGVAQAQQPIGTVGVQDATVAGSLEVTNGRAVLVGNTTVTAREHAAEVALDRGGSVRVCSTSGLHVTAGKSLAGAMPLMLALDRGAIEVQMTATTSDVVMTPDLRFAMQSDGPLDLMLRVTRNGDTCVENRGEKAPVLRVSEQFGDATYELRAGQHVLFEHGSLKEVVDHESSPCGCPPEPVMTVADALMSSPKTTGADATVTTKTVEEQHPFPAAVSEGLAPAGEAPQAPAGVVHAQVATTLSYDAASGQGTVSGSPANSGTAGGSSAAPAHPAAAGTASGAPPGATVQATPSPAPPKQTGVFHSIGHFFKRLFGQG